MGHPTVIFGSAKRPFWRTWVGLCMNLLYHLSMAMALTAGEVSTIIFGLYSTAYIDLEKRKAKGWEFICIINRGLHSV